MCSEITNRTCPWDGVVANRDERKAGRKQDRQARQAALVQERARLTGQSVKRRPPPSRVSVAALREALAGQGLAVIGPDGPENAVLVHEPIKPPAPPEVVMVATPPSEVQQAATLADRTAGQPLLKTSGTETGRMPEGATGNFPKDGGT